MCKWEIEKAIFLQKTAVGLGMDVSGDIVIVANPHSGHTYLWLEDYSFTLYMPLNCELVITDVVAIWSNPNSGEELEKTLTSKTTLKELEQWSERLNKRYAEA